MLGLEEPKGPKCLVLKGGPFRGPFLRGSEVFSHVGLHQNLKDLHEAVEALTSSAI
jgi:hypothetical protein